MATKPAPKPVKAVKKTATTSAALQKKAAVKKAASAPVKKASPVKVSKTAPAKTGGKAATVSKATQQGNENQRETYNAYRGLKTNAVNKKTGTITQMPSGWTSGKVSSKSADKNIEAYVTRWNQRVGGKGK